MVNKKQMMGSKNPSWKGSKVGYYAIHRYVSNNKPKPLICEYCKEKKKLVLANLSGEYKRNIRDWVYCCHKCHRDKHRSGEHKKPKKYVKYLKETLKKYKGKYDKITQYNKEYLKNWRENNQEYIKKYKKNNLKRSCELQRKKRRKVVTIREKYKDEFKMIFSALINGRKLDKKTYDTIYAKAETELKNRHLEEYHSI